MPSRAPPIASLQNETVKLIRSLEARKARRETGLFVAEGALVLGMARAAGYVPEMLVAGPGAASPDELRIMAWAETTPARILEVTQPVLEKLSGRDNPQSLLGIFGQRPGLPPDPAKSRPGDLWIALEEVRDPGNLGTIIRTADAAGACGVLLVGPSCDPHARECVHATMGSIFNLPPAHMEREDFLRLARSWSGDVAGLSVDAREDFRKARLEGPVLLLMGREGPGLSLELAGACTRLLAIPMAGRAQSLNLAVATALAVFQIRAPYLEI